MTVAWALIVIAILYLLDKHNLLKKALIGAAVLAALGALGFAGLMSYQWAQPKWERYQWVRKHDCFNPSTGAVQGLRKDWDGGNACEWDEVLRDRNTQLPAVTACTQEHSKPALYRIDLVNDSKKHYWQDGQWCLARQPLKLVTTSSATDMIPGGTFPPGEYEVMPLRDQPGWPTLPEGAKLILLVPPTLINVQLKPDEEDAWAIVSADGKEIWADNLEKESVKTFHADEKMVVTLAHAPSIDVTFNGKLLPRVPLDSSMCFLRMCTLHFAAAGLVIENAQGTSTPTALVDCWNSTNDKVVKCEMPLKTELDRCMASGADGRIMGTHGWAGLREGCREKIDPKYHSTLEW